MGFGGGTGGKGGRGDGGAGGRGRGGGGSMKCMRCPIVHCGRRHRSQEIMLLCILPGIYSIFSSYFLRLNESWYN